MEFKKELGEFRGSKGKWVYKESSIVSNDIDICQLWDMGDGFPSKKEAKANALLISKAPEMLEMLEMHIYALDNGMLDFYKKYGFNISELSGKVRELIKEATEL